MITSGVVRPSKIFGGVSLTDWSDLGAHGPFKIKFNATRFRVHRVTYWTISPTRRLRLRGEAARPLPTYYARNQDGEEVSREEYERRLLALEARHGAAWHRIWKTSDMFQNEREYFSPDPVSFAPSDVEAVVFMTNAPCVLGPRVLKRRRAGLRLLLGAKYSEAPVNDPYLKSVRTSVPLP